ncbi:MAG TPA: tannase/feruloyl esterase family alpha/beta hydrolase [Steroidobacteraceae bacterium]|nr:tannase/feruloyl esterase family alpha/beta hydrolase [Steroidobacteraceae bacterium]
MRTGYSILLAAAVVCCAAAQGAWAQSAADCDHLAGLKLPDTMSLAAEVVAAGQFTPPAPPAPPAAPANDRAARAAAAGRAAQAALYGSLPAFCRVSGVIKPAVRFEVWLPMQDWNGRFQGTGNGGYNGAIVYTALVAGLQKHFATANTDMGHPATSPDPASWALHHPELVVDQGYRAQHETAVKAKAIVAAFYNKQPSRSYFVGCSSGGWEALTEAHRYPHDYDGIIAGAPASEVVHLHAGQIWGYLAAQQIDADKIPMISAAVLAKCDARDGVKDGLISDPLGCDFKPAELACKSGQDPKTCLTPVEVTALQKIYAGAHNSSGALVYPGWPRGMEFALAQARSDGVAALGAGTFRDMVFDNPQWDYHTIDYDRDVKAADDKIGAVMNDGSPDLKEFRKAGGKLILWHGWSDPLISPLHTVAYYGKLAAYLAPAGIPMDTAVAQVSDFARLFLAPGVMHCGRGPGPDTFDSIGAIQAWVENGTAPDSLIASHMNGGKADRTRPLCAYPHKAVYDGKGDSNDAASFSCR